MINPMISGSDQLELAELHMMSFFQTIKKLFKGIFLFTVVYLIAEQDVLSEQALNSKIHPARFLLSAYVVSNKRAGTK